MFVETRSLAPLVGPHIDLTMAVPVLQRGESAFRLLQLFIVLFFFIFWLWMRSQGFLQTWNGAPDGAYSYGSTMFALGVVAGIWALLTIIVSIVFGVKFTYARAGKVLVAGRFGADVVAFALFTGVRVMLSTTPHQFLPDLLEPSNATTAKTFFNIYDITNAMIGITM